MHFCGSRDVKFKLGGTKMFECAQEGEHSSQDQVAGQVYCETLA